MKQTKGVDSVGNSFLAGTRSDVSDRIRRASIALLASVCLSAAGPLLVENRWWKRGGGKPFVQGGTHTQVAAFGAFSKTGGRRGSYAPFGHIGSRVQPQQGQRWRVEMCIFEWCEVVIEGLIEPSAGSRQWWSPGSSRVERVACR